MEKVEVFTFSAMSPQRYWAVMGAVTRRMVPKGGNACNTAELLDLFYCVAEVKWKTY